MAFINAIAKALAHACTTIENSKCPIGQGVLDTRDYDDGLCDFHCGCSNVTSDMWLEKLSTAPTPVNNCKHVHVCKYKEQS